MKKLKKAARFEVFNSQGTQNIEMRCVLVK